MQTGTFSIQKSDGRVELFNPQLIVDRLNNVNNGNVHVDIQEIARVVERSLYDGVKTSEIDELAKLHRIEIKSRTTKREAREILAEQLELVDVRRFVLNKLKVRKS